MGNDSATVFLGLTDASARTDSESVVENAATHSELNQSDAGGRGIIGAGLDPEVRAAIGGGVAGGGLLVVVGTLCWVLPKNRSSHDSSEPTGVSFRFESITDVLTRLGVPHQRHTFRIPHRLPQKRNLRTFPHFSMESEKWRCDQIFQSEMM
jgi:hypothetical protein